MNTGRRAFKFLIVLFLTAGVLFFPVLIYRDFLARRMVETALNLNMKDFFDGSVRLSGVHFDRRMRIHIKHFEGRLLAEAGSVPLEARDIHSVDPVFYYFSEGGLRMNFRGLRPSNSAHPGIRGDFQMRGGRNWFVEWRAAVESLDLTDLTWLNPEYFKGARGVMKGDMTIKANATMDPVIRSHLYVEKPGGQLPSRFFDGITPYLPKAKALPDLKKLSGGGAVGFQDARLKLDVLQSDRIKVFLHILIPDYNLNLNINMDIRLDEKNVLLRLGQIMGMVKIKVRS